MGYFRGEFVFLNVEKWKPSSLLSDDPWPEGPIQAHNAKLSNVRTTFT